MDGSSLFMCIFATNYKKNKQKLNAVEKNTKHTNGVILARAIGV